MKWTRFVSIVVAVFLLAGTAVGCASGKTTSEQPKPSQPEQSAAKPIEIKLSHSSPATGDRLEAACQEFAKFVAEKSGGRIKVTTYPASQLGGEREQLEGVQLGTIEMAALSSGPFPGVFPEIMVFDVPYLFSSEEVADKVLDGPVGQEILELLRKKTGIRGLAWGENGFRNFTNSVRPIVKPGDLKGLKIRTMENPAHMAIVKALGADPTPMAFGEVYTALAQRTVDGQENPVSLITSMRFYEVQKYLTLDGHVYNPYILIINDKFFSSLPQDLQNVITEGARVWQKVERELNRKQVADGIKLCKEKGMQVIELTPEQKQAFREATKSVYEVVEKQVGKELLDKVLKAVQEAEQALKKK